MPMTEDELRSMMRSRTQDPPATPDLAERAAAAGRRQRNAGRAAAAAALVAVLAVSAAVALPRVGGDVVPPASPSPTTSSTGVTTGTFTTTATIDGIATSVTGPSSVEGEAPFELEISVENPAGGQVWRGHVAAGVMYDQLVPGYFDGDLLSAQEGVVDLGLALPDAGARAVSAVQIPDLVVLAPGDKRVWVVSVSRNPAIAVTGGTSGWVAVLMRDGDVADGVGLDASSSRSVDFTPTASNLSCADVTDLTWQRGDTRGWGLESVSTAVIASQGEPVWEEVPGVDAEGGTYFDSTQLGDVQASVVIAALGEAGAAEASGYGAEGPNTGAVTEPGRYVAYAAVRMVDISFTGTCGPSGEPITGTWTAYADRASGVVTCGADTPSDPAARKAAAYCPNP